MKLYTLVLGIVAVALAVGLFVAVRRYHRSPSRRRAFAVVATVALLVGAVAAAVRPPLSPVERSLVGLWSYTADASRIHPAARVVLDLRPDRTCTIRSVALDGTELRHSAGQWRVTGGTLVCDWRDGWRGLLPPVKASLSAGVRWLQLDEREIVVVDADAMTVRRPDGDLFTWTRYAETADSP